MIRYKAREMKGVGLWLTLDVQDHFGYWAGGGRGEEGWICSRSWIMMGGGGGWGDGVGFVFTC